jgi:transposase
MTKIATETSLHTIGLDIAKNSFSIHGFDADGKTVLAKELKRGRVLGWFAELPACTVGLEACASAHHWAREIGSLPLRFLVTLQNPWRAQGTHH